MLLFRSPAPSDRAVPQPRRSRRLPSRRLPSRHLPSLRLPSLRLPSLRLPSLRLPSRRLLNPCQADLLRVRRPLHRVRCQAPARIPWGIQPQDHPLGILILMPIPTSSRLLPSTTRLGQPRQKALDWQAYLCLSATSSGLERRSASFPAPPIFPKRQSQHRIFLSPVAVARRKSAKTTTSGRGTVCFLLTITSIMRCLRKRVISGLIYSNVLFLLINIHSAWKKRSYVTRGRWKC